MLVELEDKASLAYCRSPSMPEANSIANDHVTVDQIAPPSAGPRHAISDLTQTQWWERPSFYFLLLVLAAIPLLYPPIPPLLDLPNHMGRYAVQLGIDENPALQQYYNFEWKLIGNLGVDLLVEILAPFMGMEPAVKLIVISVPVLFTLGLIWVAREVHGRLPATALFAVPLAYSYPFHFGFVNYCLAMALALLSYAVLLRLTALNLVRIRFVILFALGLITWITHVYGWALLGLLWFVTVLLRNKSRGWPTATWAAVWSSLPLALPLLPMIFWRSDNPAGIEGWFGVANKLKWIVMILRDRWMAIDILSAMVLYATIAGAFVWHRRFRFDPALLLSGAMMLTVAMLLPSTIFRSAFADVRLIPFAIAIILLSIRPSSSLGIRHKNIIAAAALSVLITKTIATTASLAIYSNTYTDELRALDEITDGSRVATFIEHPCTGQWQDDRLRHLANLAIVRSSAFVNGQFVSDGWNALQVTYRDAEPFTAFPSSMATVRTGCVWDLPTAREQVASLPENTFDYVWLLSVPAERRPITPLLEELWSTDNSVLYRVAKPGPIKMVD